MERLGNLKFDNVVDKSYKPVVFKESKSTLKVFLAFGSLLTMDGYHDH